MRKSLPSIVAMLLCAAVGAAAAPEQRWDLRLGGFFKGGTKPLWLYGRARDGQWLSVAGSSRDDSRPGNKKTYNQSWYYADLSRVPLKDGKLSGRFTLHVTPDLWVPLDHTPYTVVISLDAQVTGNGRMEGTWKLIQVNTDDPTADFGKAGALRGTVKPWTQPPLPDPVTFTAHMQGALVGGDPKYGGRCMVLSLGFEDGKLASVVHGVLSKKFEVYSQKAVPARLSDLTASPDRVAGRVVVPARTLDMEPATYVFEIDGRPLESFFVGRYKLTVEIQGKPDVTIHGSFDGKWAKGITRLAEEDDRPWFAHVEGHKPPAPGEHPRLLFRESDVPALREKAKTPEGRAILKRLRYLLDGGDGETMTTVFSKATHAYMGGGYKNTVVNKPGVYTFSHVAGYGLLYQLTGDRKYAEFGRQCFEKALAGVRDRDDRYSFRKPGGALRAGPVVGWYAVGYDLCYDGWDAATREKLGRAIADYREGEGNKAYDLERLARGTMPPGSNHFGMQVGGASLALLALTGEAFVDQERIDTLLKIAQQSVIRNLSEGFGDGGFFAEGDGTGSMSSHIAYLSALTAWRNVAGKDFIHVERPNARMLALKWVYQTVFRDGKPDFWPIRGAYGHNVWARRGLSGAGYFAIGLGAVTPDQQAAVKWCYSRFLLAKDKAAGAPYDTVSPYPHVSVCAFVNWPVGLPGKKPEAVLPHCYRDSSCGFYCWRNRWRDGRDTVITVLSNRTRGYMTAKPDRQLKLNTTGKHLRWGTVTEGPTDYWWMSPRGETSSLTLADGTCFAADFTGASGADTMLVTTGEAEGQSVKVGGTTLIFYFPTAADPPQVRAEDDAAVVGKQRVTLEDGHLVLSHHGR